jgi:hypothetical protein
MKQESKYKGLSVIIRSEEEFNIMKTLLGEYLYLEFVPQMLTTETSIILYYEDTNIMSIGSVGSSKYQSDVWGVRLIEFSDFFINNK